LSIGDLKQLQGDWNITLDSATLIPWFIKRCPWRKVRGLKISDYRTSCRRDIIFAPMCLKLQNVNIKLRNEWCTVTRHWASIKSTYFDGFILQNFNLELSPKSISIALFEVIRILARDFAGGFLVHSTYRHLGGFALRVFARTILAYTLESKEKLCGANL